MTVAINVKLNTAMPMMTALLRDVKPRRIAAAIAPALKKCVTDNYGRLPANKMGWPSTGYWANCIRATSYQVSSSAALVSTSWIGIRQRYYGGVIEAGHGTSSKTGAPTKYLAIPARAEAYGKTPAMFDNLVPVFRRLMGQVKVVGLAEAEASQVSFGRTRKDGSRKVTDHGTTGGGILFWLKETVTQEANPNVLPNDAAIDETIDNALQPLIK